MHAADAQTVVGTRWTRTTNPALMAGAADNVALWNPNLGNAKISTGGSAVQNPASYFQHTFDAEPGTPYHLWIRMKAENDHYANDSIHVQFDGSLNDRGQPVYRIGSTSSAEIVLQESDGGTRFNWGWADNGWGGNGINIYFERGGTQTIRVQQREDGVLIDQIVISPDTYLQASPGAQMGDGTILTGR
jgi:hypothetical protein